MRIVIDTNVLISGLMFDGLPERVVKLAVGKDNELVISPYIISETSRNLRKKFDVKAESIQLFQATMNACQVVYFDPYLHVITDEPDNRVLETAIEGKAEFIITGDKLLLELGNYEGVKIVTPAKFLKLGLQN